MPVYTFNTGGVKGGLHQVEFEVTDEEEAYIVTAKMFCTWSLWTFERKSSKKQRAC